MTARQGTADLGRPPRFWTRPKILVAVTIGALVPLGVGFAVALSARQGSVVRPPAATVTTADGEVTAAEGAWCWRADQHSRCSTAASGEARRAPMLPVSRSRPGVVVRFAIRQTPTSLQVTVAQPGGTGRRGVAVVGRNPGRFVPPSFLEGSEVSIRAAWPQGRVTYLVRLQEA